MRFPWQTKRQQNVSALFPYNAGIPMSSPRNVRAMAVEAFATNSLAFACVARKAQSATDIKLKVEQLIQGEWVDSADTSKRTPEADEYQALLDNPNPRQSQSLWLQDAIACDQITGNAYSQIELSGSGRPVALWNLPRPELMAIIPDPVAVVGGYRYNTGAAAVTLPPEQVLHFRELPDPQNPLYGISPLVSIARELDADNAANDFLTQFFAKGGVPALAALVKGSVDDKFIASWRAKWESAFSIGQGGNAAGGIAILEDAQITLQKIGSTTGSREMGLQEVRQVIEARVCAAYGVHPQVLFTLIGFLHPNYAQARAALEQTWQMGLLPMYGRFVDVINIGMRPYYPNCRVILDTSKVAALADDQDALWSRHMKAFEIGLESDEEARAALGLPAEVKGRRFMPTNRVQLTPDGDMAPRVTATETIALTPAQLQEQESGKPVEAAPPAVTARTGTALEPDAPKQLPAGKAFKANSDKAKRHAARMEKLRARIAGETEPKLGEYFAGLSERVTHRLNAQDSKELRLLRQYKADAEFPFTADDLLPGSEDRMLSAILTPLWLQAMEDGWDATAAEWSLESAFSVTNPEIERLLRTASSDRVRQITDSTRTAIREALALGASRGYSVRQLANGVIEDGFVGIKALVDQTYEGRARTIARTEAMWASNGASVALYKAEGIEQAEMSDGDYDEICKARDGQIVSLAEAEQNMAAEHPNGNLSIAPVVAGSS